MEGVMKKSILRFATLLLALLLALGTSSLLAAQITVELRDGSGARITSGATLRYNDGAWQTNAVDNGDGTFTVTTSATSLYYEMTYDFGKQQLGPIPSSTTWVTFQTTTTTVRLENSNHNGLSGGVARYYQSSWQSAGTTDGSGNSPTMELLPGSYYFDMDYNYGHQQIGLLAVSGNAPHIQTVTFTTIATTVRLQKSDGTGLNGGLARYYQRTWTPIGNTGTGVGDGNAPVVELLPGSYYFDMDYNYGHQQVGLLAVSGASQTVTFTTTATTVRLLKSDGTGLNGGLARYYQRTWTPIGNTGMGVGDGNAPVVELLPGNYHFDMTYVHAIQQKGLLTVNGTALLVTFQTTEVTVELLDYNGSYITTPSAGTARYYVSSAWYSLGTTGSDGYVKIELLPVSYYFDMTCAHTVQQEGPLSVSGTTQKVTFQTGQVIQGPGTICTQYYVGAWWPFASGIELLPGSYYFKFDDNTSEAYAVVAGTVLTIPSPPPTSPCAPPSITSQPTTQTVCSPLLASFTASATGTDLYYQWRKNNLSLSDGGNISGVNTGTLTISPTSTGDAGMYDVVVSGACTPSVTSEAKELIVNQPPNISSQPAGQTVSAPSSATFSITAAGTGLSYQWRKNGSPLSDMGNISGVAGTTLTINPTSEGDAGSYDVVVTGTCGSLTSSAATLEVNTPPSVTTSPSNQVALAGTSVSFTAAAGGNPVPTVQWQMSTNGGTSWSDVGGGTATTLALSSVTTSQNGRKYQAVFTNSCGSAITDAVLLTVNPSATLKVQFIVYEVLDNRCRPKIRCVPVEGAEVRVYTLRELCANDLVVTGQPKTWGKIYDGLDGPGGDDPGCPILTVGSYVAKGVTNANGQVSIIVPPTTTKPDIDYVVIGSTLSFDDVKTADDPDALYSGVRIASIRAGNQKVVALRRLRLFSGKIVPATALEETGTYLAIVEPEYMDWDSDQEQYPFVMESDGDWSVATTVEPPEGFVSDYSSLSTEVEDTTTAIQFTLTDVGSKWTSTSVKHVIRHKGKVKVRGFGVPMFDKKKGKMKNGTKGKQKGNSINSAAGGGVQALTQGTAPTEYALYQNYPDPFNPSTTLQFDLPEPALVTMRVYNTLGQEVASLLDHMPYEPGKHAIKFDASRLSSGVYIYQLIAGRFVDTKKMLLLK
jgi:hypothetical protein